MPRGELSGNSSRARRSLGEQTRSALAARLNRRGKKSESRRFAASGLKPSLILHDLRGAKAPLYHSAAGFRDFFRSLLEPKSNVLLGNRGYNRTPCVT